MITPTRRSKDYKAGDRVVNTSTLSENYFTVSIGHEFIVVKLIVGYDKYLVKDSESDLEFEISSRDLSPKSTLKEAKKEYEYYADIYFFKTYFERYCPHKGVGYEDRDTYDSCELKTRRNDYCVPCPDCFKYAKDFDDDRESETNKKRIQKYIRTYKLKDLTK